MDFRNFFVTYVVIYIYIYIYIYIFKEILNIRITQVISHHFVSVSICIDFITYIIQTFIIYLYDARQLS